MSADSVKSPDSGPSRRQILGAAAASTLGLLMPAAARGNQDSRAGSGTQPAPAVVQPPWWLTEHGPRSRVVDVRSRKVVDGSTIDPVLLGDMLIRSIKALTGEATLKAAWRKVLGPANRIVLKFNSIGADVIKTSDALARQVVDQLLHAGYDRAGLGLVEAPDYLPSDLGELRPVEGWTGSIRVGDSEQTEQLARYLVEADAIINIPFLKTHQIAGMTCCMKNISHAVVRHPARYHANGCSPYVGQILAAPEVSSRIRLNIVDALRIVFRNGPDATNEDTSTYGGLLLGYDPVAVDTTAHSLLEIERRRLELMERIRVPYLVSAARMGLGRAHPADIDRMPLEMKG